ncbi:MAG: site-specific DNA-methyltransferase, partial [Armatimonadota bacterium]|nr:site-specific DNA-methyltransferase [Armatimonadota bacterium]
MPKVDRLPLTSSALLAERLEDLRALIPEAFCENRIDFDRLKAALGGVVDTGHERYGLNWNGKGDAIRTIQSLSVGTLRPSRAESVDFDTTGNMIIEGDNLEVLKLLQKSYHGKVKMIYIDPPYNTGNEFIYPDNFREGLQDYLRYSGQVSEDGFRTSTNSETDGRFHSKWLNMMYPRLFLARNLLKDDGVIFVSIDDHEVHNLRLLMNEVFGEENFQADIAWQRKYAVSNNYKGIGSVRESILVFSRSEAFVNGFLARSVDSIARYANPDNDPRGAWKPVDYWNQASPAQRPNLVYPIVNPRTQQVVTPGKKAWKYSLVVHETHVAEGRIWWGAAGTNSVPALKLFRSDVRDGLIPHNWWSHNDAGHTDEAKKELESLFSVAPFETPKPTR